MSKTYYPHKPNCPCCICSPRSGENHWAWQEKIKYRSIHTWVVRCLGQPSICSECGTTDSPRYDWANISGKYLREISDYIRLCRKCHSNFDSQFGENHPMAKLNTQNVLDIRKDYSTGKVNKTYLAKKFNVTLSNIIRIIKRKTWKHI